MIESVQIAQQNPKLVSAVIKKAATAGPNGTRPFRKTSEKFEGLKDNVDQFLAKKAQNQADFLAFLEGASALNLITVTSLRDVASQVTPKGKALCQTGGKCSDCGGCDLPSW